MLFLAQYCPFMCAWCMVEWSRGELLVHEVQRLEHPLARTLKERRRDINLREVPV